MTPDDRRPRVTTPTTGDDDLAIAARALGRRFGTRTALRSVDLALPRGRILGLAGPNGSGKTTLLKLLAGLLRPDAGGDVTVLGQTPWRDRPALMRRARFAFAPPALYESMTGREHVRWLGALGATTAPRRADVADALATVGLDDRADDRVSTYSFGMRQRLALAQALVPRPELLVLDEPADGLDPLAVLELRDVLRGLRADHGITIVLSSHLLLELDELVDELLVLDGGDVLFHGTPAALRGTTDGVVLGIDDAHAETARRALADAAVPIRSDRPHTRTLERALLDRLRARRTTTADAASR